MDNIFTADGINIVAAEALAHLKDALVINTLCTTNVGAEYNIKPNGYSVGDTVNFKIDPVYEAKSFDPAIGVIAQPIRSSNRSMTIEDHLDITTEVSAKDKALSFEGFAAEVIRPAAFSLAEKVDKYMAGKIMEGAGLYVSDDLFGAVSGNGGKDLAQARKVALMQQLGMDKFCLMNPELEATLLGQDWFTGAQNRGDDRILRSGEMGTTMGLDFFSTVNWQETTHTSSSGVATLTGQAEMDSAKVNMVGQMSVVCYEITGGFLAGDRITIAGTKRPMIVAADKAAAINTAPIADRTVVVVDPITEILTASAAVTVVGSGLNLDFQGAIFDGKSLGMAMPLLDKPENGLSSVLSSDGISIRVVADYDSKFKISQLSMDCLIGGFALDPRRITLLAEGV